MPDRSPNLARGVVFADLLVEQDQVLVDEEVGKYYATSEVGADALDRLGWSKDGLVRDAQRVDKFVSYAHGRFVDGPHPLVGLYEIRLDAPGSDPVQQHGAQKFTTLLRAIYRPYLVQVCDTRRLVYDVSLATSRRFTCWRGGRLDPVRISNLLDYAAAER